MTETSSQLPTVSGFGIYQSWTLPSSIVVFNAVLFIV